MPPLISVVIPAYNEEKNIGNTLALVLEYFQSKDWPIEIIVSEDASQDKTVEVVESFMRRDGAVRLLRNLQNRGKGSSVRKAVLEAMGEYILFTDADNSTPIEEIEKLVSALQHRKCDIAIASRALAKSKIEIAQPLYRQVMGKVFNIFVRIFLGLNLRDTQCGFKCFPREIGKKVFSLQRLERFCFDAELLYIAKKKGYRILEIPVVWRNRADSKVRPLQDATRMFRDLYQIRKNDSQGLYKD